MVSIGSWNQDLQWCDGPESSNKKLNANFIKNIIANIKSLFATPVQAYTFA